MSGLLTLTRQLAEGTSAQKRRSWRLMVLEGALWQACKDSLDETDSLAELRAASALLLRRWDRGPVLQLTGSGLPQIEKEVRQMHAFVAGAAMTAAARSHVLPPEELYRWAARAACVELHLPRTPEVSDFHTASAERRIRLCFQHLVDLLPERATPLAIAQDMCLSLLWGTVGEEKRPTDLQMQVPLLLARGNEGFLVWLWLERVRGGFGQFFQAPSTVFEPILPDLKVALTDAWRQAHELLRPDEDLRWWLTNQPPDATGRPLPVGGDSAAAAAAVGIRLLLRGSRYNARYAISAAVGPDGILESVNGLTGIAPKLEAARALRTAEGPAYVVVSRKNQLSAATAAGWGARGVRVIAAHTVEDAAQLAEYGGPPTPQPAGAAAANTGCLSLLYARRAQPDELVAAELATTLRSEGFALNTVEQQELSVAWAQETEKQIRNADAVIFLLSAASVSSETLAYEIQLAHEAAERSRRPRLIAVTIGEFPAPTGSLAGNLASIEQYPYSEAAGVAALAATLAAALRHPPLAAIVPPEEVQTPNGVLTLGSPVYITRNSDHAFHRALACGDRTIRIKGARQMGKTSLLSRGLQAARDQGALTVTTDFQLLNAAHLESIDALLRTIGRWLIRQLPVELSLDDFWDPLQGASWNFRDLLLELLARVPGRVVWGLDEVDRLFTCEFRNEVFGLFRSWHNDRALNPSLPWNRLTLAMSYATEAHLFLADLNQSPFNVGTRITLQDFTPQEVSDLNDRYGRPLRNLRELEEYWQLLGGHPYLTHRGLHEMAATASSLDSLRQRAEHADGPFGDHLRRLLLLLARDPEMAAAVRQILAGQPELSSNQHCRLWSGGVVVGDSPDAVRVRCQLYASYLERHLR